MSFILNAFKKKGGVPDAPSPPSPTSTSSSSPSSNNSTNKQKLKKRIIETSYSNYYSRLDKTSKQSCGLVPKGFGGSSQFEMTDFNIKVEMGDTYSQTVFTQTYKNGYTSPVEAKYEIPLAPYSAVSNFVVEYDGKILHGEVKPKEEAFNTFSDAIASGNQAFLGEKSEKGLFSFSIGNLPPGKQVIVSITIVSEVGLHLSDLHYSLHRYMFPDNSINLSVDMTIALSSPIDAIEVDQYSQDTELIDNKATVLIKHKGRVNQNLVIIVKPKVSNDKPAYHIESIVADKTAAVALNFYPQFQIAADEVDQKSEFIFLLDCSGSMSGTPITKAKRALEILMRSLTEKSKFNIFVFGSSFKSMFESSQSYNDETLETASRYIQQIQANLGGTELLPPIRSILSSSYDPQYPRQVFILTDGEISERDQLIDYVGREANTTRIFTLGIGGGVDKDLVLGLSRACKGHYEFIEDNGQMEVQVMKLMSIALEPTISNIRVNWGDLVCRQAPQIVRPIFNNERMIIFGLIENAPTEGVKEVIITCDGPSGTELVYNLSLDFSTASSTTSVLHTLTAYELIKDMEELERKKQGDFKDKIIALGVKYRLVSKHTSFVVVSESDQPTLDPVTQVDVIKNVDNINNNNNNNVEPLAATLLTSSLLLSRQVSYSLPSSDDEDADWEDQECASIAPTPSRHFIKHKASPLFSTPSAQVDSFAMMDCLQESISESMALEPVGGMLEREEGKVMKKKSVRKGEKKDKEKDKKAQSPRSSSLSSPSPPPAPTRQSSSSHSSAPPRVSSQQSVPAPASTTTGDVLLNLIRSQKANGSWISGSVSITIPPIPSDIQSYPDVWLTLLVIAKITKQFAANKDQWELVVNKAQTWVIRTLSLQQSKEKYQQLLDIALASI